MAKVEVAFERVRLHLELVTKDIKRERDIRTMSTRAPHHKDCDGFSFLKNTNRLFQSEFVIRKQHKTHVAEIPVKGSVWERELLSVFSTDFKGDFSLGVDIFQAGVGTRDHLLGDITNSERDITGVPLLSSFKQAPEDDFSGSSVSAGRLQYRRCRL